MDLGCRAITSRQAGHRLLTARRRVLDQPALEQLDRREGRRAGDRVAAVRGAVGADAPRFHDLRGRDHRAQGHAAGDALGGEQDVRLDAPMLDRPHLAGPPGAGLDLVGDEQDAVLRAQLPEPLEEAVLGDDVATLALDRLDHDRGDLVRGHEPAEKDVVEPLEVLDPAERRVIDAGEQRVEAGVILRFRRGQGDGAIRPAMKPAEESNDVRAPGVVAGELHRGLDRLRAGVAEVRPELARHRRDPRDRGRGLGVDRQVEVRGRVVDELGRLLLDRADDAGMAVARGVDRDARREVEEQVPVDVLDGHAQPADRHDRVGAREAGRGPRLVELDVRASLRAGDLRDQVRQRPIGDWE